MRTLNTQCVICSTPVIVELPGPMVGTFFMAPARCASCLEAERAALAARPSYAETQADRMIAAIQGDTGVDLSALRPSIIKTIEDMDE